MIEIEMTIEERETLSEVLDGCISDLRMEIASTDNWDFREDLKVRKELLLKLARAVRPAMAQV